MPNIGDAERVTQNRVVKFFRDKLHYTYLGDLHDTENSNVKEEKLKNGIPVNDSTLEELKSSPIRLLLSF